MDEASALVTFHSFRRQDDVVKETENLELRAYQVVREVQLLEHLVTFRALGMARRLEEDSNCLDDDRVWQLLVPYGLQI